MNDRHGVKIAKGSRVRSFTTGEWKCGTLFSMEEPSSAVKMCGMEDIMVLYDDRWEETHYIGDPEWTAMVELCDRARVKEGEC